MCSPRKYGGQAEHDSFTSLKACGYIVAFATGYRLRVTGYAPVTLFISTRRFFLAMMQYLANFAFLSQDINYRMIMKAKYLLLAMVTIALGACSSSKKASVSDIDGTWTIVKVEGTDLEGDPYIGFNTTSGRVYGNTGCNNLLGSFDTNAPAGVLSLGNLGSTRMMCPDMTTENIVLEAMAKVTGFKKTGNGYALLDSDGKIVAELQPRYKEMKARKLDGEWQIVRINGERLPSGLNSEPKLIFDAEQLRVSGNGGCNTINGSYKTDGTSIEFSQMISTMMACENMDTEAALLNALEKASKFGTIPNGNLGLLDDGDRLLIELKHK